LAIGGVLLVYTASTATAVGSRDDQQTFNSLTARAALWLGEHAKPGSRVMALYKISSWMRFNSGGTFPIEDLTTWRTVRAPELVRQARFGRKWLFITVTRDDGLFPGYAAIPFDILEDELRHDRVDYLVLTGGFGPASLAIDGAFQMPTYREVYRDATRGREDRQELVIYQVSRNGLDGELDIPVVMSPGTLEQLAKDLGTGPGSALDLLLQRGVRLDLQSGGVRDLEPGWDISNPRSVGGWLSRQHDDD
jgi:hypothetical protein